MELREAILRRRMVRAFEERPVDPEVIDRMLEHAVHAPSAGFSQGWAFLVLTEREDQARFWDAVFPTDRGSFGYPGLFNAGCIIVPLSHKQAYLDRYAEPDKGWPAGDEDRWPVPYWDTDTAMASMLILLTAVDEGLGALFFGIFGEHIDAFKRAFGVPSAFTPIGAIAIGHRASDKPSPSLQRGHRGLDEVVHRGRW
ncbi:MAG: nitroreductase family protein [Acidimicrobiales bacterium]